MNNSTIKCSECPFARHIEGDIYICSAWGIADWMGEKVRGHWESDQECHEELEKAKRKEKGYHRHWIYDERIKDDGFNEEAIASFLHPKQEQEQEQAQEELETYLASQSYKVFWDGEIAKITDWLATMKIEYSLTRDIVPTLIIWGSKAKYDMSKPIVVARLSWSNYQSGWFDLRGGGVYKSSLKDAIARVLENHQTLSYC